MWANARAVYTQQRLCAARRGSRSAPGSTLHRNAVGEEHPCTDQGHLRGLSTGDFKEGLAGALPTIDKIAAAAKWLRSRFLAGTVFSLSCS